MARTKAQSEALLHPVEVLKGHVVALDAAMLVAVTAAEVGAVHKLRTGTRRVEACMRMLDVLAAGSHPARVPEHAKEARTVDRRLTRVRRAAGAVRDLDVQVEIIRYDIPSKAAVHDGTPGDTVRRQGKALRKHLQAQREHQAKGLIEILKTEERKLAAALQELEEALKPASHPAVSAERLHECIQAWFTARTASLLPAQQVEVQDDLRAAIENLDSEALHALRKAAKLCRYMAESTPNDAPLRQAAERFEAVQEAGGKWHDWLLLTQISGKFHGRKAELTRRFRKHRDAALAEYRLRLVELLPLLAAKL